MENEDPNFITMEYDDGVVCFGPVTESQLERTRRLPRHTVVPSDLSQSFEDEDDENKDETNVCITESSTNNLGNKEETSTNELKQSFTEDSLSVCSSPCVTGIIPSEKLIDTEVINRYIRMESSDESYSEEEDQDKSVFEDNDPSSCEHLNITDVKEKNSSNEPKNIANVDNVCTLKPCSQEEDKDLSIYSEMELEDAEDSIVADKYSVTPGKQRLFDLRPAKSSFRNNTFVASAPYMDRIDETVTPTILECPKIIVHDISYDLLKTKENLDFTSVTGINQSVKQLEFESTKFIDETQNTFDQIMESNTMEVDIKSSNTIILSNNFENTECNSSTNEESINTDMDNVLNNSAKPINVSSMNKSISFNESNKMENSLYVSEQIFGIENSPSNFNVVDNQEIKHDYENDKLVKEVGIKLDDSIRTNNLSTINDSVNLNKTWDESNTIENTLNDTEQKFQMENSNMSLNFNEVNVDVENDNGNDASIMEVEIKSPGTIVDNKLDDSVSINNLSTINNSVNVNKMLDESNKIDNTLNVTEQKFEVENINITSNFNVENNNGDDTSIMEVEIKSHDAIVDNKLDDSVGTNNLSTVDNSENMNKMLDESNKIDNTLNITEQKIDVENVNMTSNFNVDNGDDSSSMEVEIKSHDAIVDNKLYDSVGTKNLSTVDNSENMNKMLDESNKIDNTLNVTEQKFEVENINITSNFNGDDTSIMEVEIKSHDAIVDNKLDDSVSINNLSTINNSVNVNKMLDESNKIDNTLNVTEQKFEVENINMTSNFNVDNGDDTSIMEVEIKSHDAIMDNKLDYSVGTKNLSTVDNSENMNKMLDESNKIDNTLNITEQKIDVENVNMTSNFNVDNGDDSSSMEVEIKSHDAIVDNKLYDSVGTKNLSTVDNSENMNKMLDESNKIDNTLNVTEQKFEVENINITSNFNGDDTSIMEAEIKSHDAIVDNKLDDSVGTNNLSTVDNSENMNKMLDESNKIDNTLNITEQKFDVENVNMTSNFNVDNGDDSSSMEVEIKSHDAIVDNKLDDSVSTINLSNKIDNTLDVTAPKFEMENPNMSSGLNLENDNEDEKSIIEAEIKSNNISIVDKIPDDTKCTNNSVNDKRNIYLHETNTLGINEPVLEKSVQSIPNNITVSTFNSDTTLQFAESDDNLLTDKTNSEISYSENLKHSDTNEFSVASNKTKESSHAMRQYLDFEQTVYELCHNISSASCNNTQLNESINYDNQTQENISMIENALHSETFNDTEVDQNISDNNVLKSNLSVIIENRTLEENSVDVVETNCSKSVVVEDNLDTGMLNNSIKQNVRESIVSKVVEPLSNNSPKMEKNIDEGILTLNSVNDSSLLTNNDKGSIDTIILVEEANTSQYNETSSVFGVKLSKTGTNTLNVVDNQLIHNAMEQKLAKGVVKEMFLNNINEMSCQNKLNEPSNFIATEILGSEKPLQSSIEQEQIVLPNCDNQQLNITGVNENLSTSLSEYNKLEQMFNFDKEKKVQQFEIQTPKAQKLVDFSFVQQTPQSQMKKQKLFNFSIVDQTPASKNMHQAGDDDKFVKHDVLIDFSSVDQTENLEEFSADKIIFTNSSSCNISTVTAPDIELLIDDTIKTDSSNQSNSTFNQTLTETNLNQSENLCEIKEETNISSFSKGIDENYLFEVSEQNKKHDLNITTSEYVKPESKCLLDNTFNQNSNERAIVDFSIVEQPMSQTSNLENGGNVKHIASDCNILNLMEMSVANPKSNEQMSILSENTVTAKTSGKDFEISRDICSDEINNSVTNIEKFKLTHNTELLSDIQMDDVSLLMESSEKSSVGESFHSIELDHVHEDNKRKMDEIQEHQVIEKKMKVECDEPKTPMSMLYKIRNMFKSSERRQHNWASSSKENFNKFEENDNGIRNKSLNIVKSKIPCKVTDKSMTKNDDFNISSSLNNSAKPKKTIPRFTGLPVLSDLSNSSNTKCPESHNPSKF